MSVLTRTRDDGGGGGNLDALRHAADASRAQAGFRNDRDPTTAEEERYWKALNKTRLSSNVRVNGILTRTRQETSGRSGGDPRATAVANALNQIFKDQKWFSTAWDSTSASFVTSGFGDVPKPSVTVMINSTMPAPPGQSDYEQADLALPLSMNGVDIFLMHADVGLPRGGVQEKQDIALPGGTVFKNATTTRQSEEKLAALRARDALMAEVQAKNVDIRGATIEKSSPNSPPILRVKVATIEDAKQVPDVVWGISIAVDLVAAMVPIATVLVAGRPHAGATITTLTKVDGNGVPWTVTEMGTNSFMARSTTYSPPATVFADTLAGIDKKIEAYASTHHDLTIFSSIGQYVDENGGIWFRTNRWDDEGYPLPSGKQFSAKPALISINALGYPKDTEVQADTEMALKGEIDKFAFSHKKKSTPTPAPKPKPTIPGGGSSDIGVSDEEDTSVSDSIDDPDTKPETLTEATLPPPSTSVATAIRAAAAVFDRSATAKTATPAARQEALAIGMLENLYGTNPDWYFVTPEGKKQPAYNWGATMARKGDLVVVHGDKDAAGKSVTRTFAAFRTADEGFARFWQIFAKPDTLAAANDGNATDTAAAMYSHGYFGGTSGSATARIERYAKAVKSAADVVASVLGEAKLVRLEGTPILVKKATGGGGGLLLGGAAILGLGVIALKALV